jgi:hypothetical protein
MVLPTEVHFGTVFPEEWLLEHILLKLSTSFCSDHQLRVSHVDYEVWAQKKVGDPPGPQDEYFWLGDALYLKLDFGTQETPTGADDMTRITPILKTAPASPIGPLLAATLIKPSPLRVLLWVGLDVPVFREFYNVLTDPTPKPSGLNLPSVIIETDEDRYIPEGVDLGIDLVIQVTSIHNPKNQPGCGEELPG